MRNEGINEGIDEGIDKSNDKGIDRSAMTKECIWRPKVSFGS